MAGELNRFSSSVSIYAALAIWAASASFSFAQTSTAPADASSTPPPPGAEEKGNKAKGVNGPAFDNVRKALDALTPEQRKRFQENFLRWANLSPEEKKALREREEVRKKIVALEVDTAIKESGLQLDSEHHELFVKRYGEERRKIEEQLRKEMQEKRKPMVKDLIGRLKQEFSAAATTTTTNPSTPVPTVAPQN